MNDANQQKERVALALFLLCVFGYVAVIGMATVAAGLWDW